MFYNQSRALRRRLLQQSYPAILVAAKRLLLACPTPGMDVETLAAFGLVRAMWLADMLSREPFGPSAPALVRKAILTGAIKAMAMRVRPRGDERA